PTRESATQPQPQDTAVTRTISEGVDNSRDLEDGGVTEWPNVPVLKTGDLARGPRVQISPPPPNFPAQFQLLSRELWLKCVAFAHGCSIPFRSGVYPAEVCGFLGRVWR